MLGNNFFVPGRAYRVITHRPDTAHLNHYLEIGEKVICKGVIRAGEDKLLMEGPNKPRTRPTEFRNKNLRGYFVDTSGFDQMLASGDVKVWRD